MIILNNFKDNIVYSTLTCFVFAWTSFDSLAKLLIQFVVKLLILGGLQRNPSKVCTKLWIAYFWGSFLHWVLFQQLHLLVYYHFSFCRLLFVLVAFFKLVNISSAIVFFLGGGDSVGCVCGQDQTQFSLF